MEGKFKFFVIDAAGARRVPVKKCMRTATNSTYACLEYEIPCPRYFLYEYFII